MKLGPAPIPGRPPLNLRWLCAGLLILALIAIVRYRTQPKPLDPPVPTTLARLDPQLRHYISNHLDWVRAAPADGRRHATLGLIYAANSLWSDARQAFVNAATLNPDQPLAHLYVAIATDQSGDLTNAITQYRQVAQRFPTLPQAHYRLGDALLRQGELDAAATSFQHLVTLAPGEWRGHAGLGDIALRRGQPTVAAPLVEHAVKLSPETRSLRHLLGLVYRELGRTQEAEIELRKGLDAIHYPMPDEWSLQAPRHMRTLPDQFEQARDHLAHGRPDQAVAALEPALPFHPTSASLLENLAVALNAASRPVESATLLQRLLQLDPKHVNAHVLLTESAIAMGNLSNAMAHAEQALALAPNQPQPHLAHANVLLALDRDTEALASVEAAIARDPRNPLLPLQAGELCMINLDQPARALEFFRAARALDPTATLAYYREVELLLKSGDTTTARNTWEQLRRVDSTAPDFDTQVARFRSLPTPKP